MLKLMKVTQEQSAIWERAFKAGAQDMGAILISGLIFDGHTSIRINDLKKYIAEITRPRRDLSEHILELLEALEREHTKLNKA